MELTQEYREFLNDLRRSGEVNMFGAAPVLATTFGLTKPQARKVLSLWMTSFDPALDS